MHDAYEASPILEKLPLKIESIACYGKSPAVGFSRPKILVFSSVCIITLRLNLLVPNFCLTRTWSLVNSCLLKSNSTWAKKESGEIFLSLDSATPPREDYVQVDGLESVVAQWLGTCLWC